MQKFKEVITNIKELVKEARQDGKKQIRYPISRLRYNVLKNSLAILGLDISFVDKNEESYILIKV
jgi:DUF438 domain-containing protein